MFNCNVLCAKRNPAGHYAADFLSQQGIKIADSPGPDVTHLLLPVPSFPSGDTYLAYILSDLPDHIIVSGGMLQTPLLENYRTVDFLRDPFYLAENAAITADCTANILLEKFPHLKDVPVLILGWGRIGKCLGHLLQLHEADVTITARKSDDVAIIHALGFTGKYTGQIREYLSRYRVIINTVPELILPGVDTDPDTLIIDLASKPGITGANVLSARGLPGKMAPEKSGRLIAKTFMRLSI